MCSRAARLHQCSSGGAGRSRPLSSTITASRTWSPWVRFCFAGWLHKRDLQKTELNWIELNWIELNRIEQRVSVKRSTGLRVTNRNYKIKLQGFVGDTDTCGQKGFIFWTCKHVSFIFRRYNHCNQFLQFSSFDCMNVLKHCIFDLFYIILFCSILHCVTFLSSIPFLLSSLFQIQLQLLYYPLSIFPPMLLCSILFFM